MFMKPPTAKQQTALKKWCVVHGVEYPTDEEIKRGGKY